MPQWPPRIPRQGGAGPTPPGGQDIRAPKLIVGNEPAGDTAAVCDFLDPGDGTGFAAALAAAADTGGDIWLRPGRYNLGLPDSPALPLVLPGGVTIRGSGSQPSMTSFGPGASAAVLVVGDTRNVLTGTDFADLIDIYFEVAPIVTAASGTRMVSGGFLRMTRVTAFLPFAPNPAETLQWLFVAGTLRSHNLQVVGGYDNGEDGGTPLGALQGDELHSTDDWIFGIDIGAQMNNQGGSVTGANFDVSYRALTSHGRAHIAASHLQVNGEFATESVLVNDGSATIIGNHIRATSSASGILVGLNARGATIVGNYVYDTGTGVYVSGTTSRVLIGFNDLDDTQQSVYNESPRTETAHNFIHEFN